MKRSSTLKRVLLFLRTYRFLIVLSVLLAAAGVAGSLYIPILVGDAIDCIVSAGRVDFAGIARTGGLIALTAALTAAAQWLMNVINNRITFSVTRDLRQAAFRHLQELPVAYLDAHPAGEILSRVISDADQFADGLLIGFTQLFSGVLTILGTLVFMVRIDWRISLVVVVLTPLSLFVAKYIATHTHDMFTLQSKERGEQTAFVNEILEGLRVVQAFGREENCLETFDEINGRLRKSGLKATFFSSLVNPSTRMLTNIVYACVGLVGALSAVGGAISVGQLSVFLSYAGQYAKPFNEISGVITEMQNALACAGRLFDLLDEPAQEPDAPDAAVLRDIAGRVELEHVDFSYVPDRPLIEDLNLRAEPGQHVAIVGPTGCGKTTLINLLMRFYDVDGGAVRVEGRDIRNVTRRSLRAGYGMVLQDTWLKAGTIRENIALGRPDAAEEEIRAAAKAVHADSFIRRLPGGYDAVIGEDGGSLSQGQKQLLCIARVMLRLPPVLILDEATSSIDTRTELKIQQAFAKLTEGRTSFIVAHRLSTIREADVILVMRDGRIIEQGRHDELLRKGGFYAELYNSQFAR